MLLPLLRLIVELLGHLRKLSASQLFILLFIALDNLFMVEVILLALVLRLGFELWALVFFRLFCL